MMILRILLLVLLFTPPAIAQEPWFMSDNRIQVDYCLEKAPRAKVLDFLAGQYERVIFTPHRTGSGFHALGSREDLLQIRRELVNLDRTSRSLVRLFIPVEGGDIHEARKLLKTLVPDATYKVDTHRQGLLTIGTPGVVEQVQELLKS